jgi:hypothetical protein
MPEAGLPVHLAPAQLTRMSQLGDQWSFLWDKRRSLWIAAEDCPDGEQVEEADLDMLLARLPLRLWVRNQRNRVASVRENGADKSGRVRVSAGQHDDGLQNRGRRGRGRVDDGPC